MSAPIGSILGQADRYAKWNLANIKLHIDRSLLLGLEVLLAADNTEPREDRRSLNYVYRGCELTSMRRQIISTGATVPRSIRVIMLRTFCGASAPITICNPNLDGPPAWMFLACRTRKKLIAKSRRLRSLTTSKPSAASSARQ